MRSDNGKPSNSAPQILPLVIAAFAGATLAIACERPASRMASAEPEARPAAEQPRTAQAAPQPAAAPPAPAMPSKESLADPAIAARIRTAMLADPAMAGADVSVTADDGAITLVGSVKSHEQIAVASAHAQRQDGITRVDNHLAVEMH